VQIVTSMLNLVICSADMLLQVLQTHVVAALCRSSGQAYQVRYSELIGQLERMADFGFRAEEIDGASPGLKKWSFRERSNRHANITDSVYTCGLHGVNTALRFSVGQYREPLIGPVHSLVP
jgi:hypothetical protein